MMSNCAKNVIKIISCLVTGLVLLTSAVQAQTDLGGSPAPLQALPSAPPSMERSSTPGRASSSYQPGANYRSNPTNTPKTSVDRIARAKQQEQNLRHLMSSFGVTEADIQNAIIFYLQDEVQGRQPLREQVRKLSKALNDEAMSTTEMTQILADFRVVVEADKVRRKDALADLNEKTGYSTNPRLEAMLLLFGIIGDGPTIMTIPVPYASPTPRNDQPAPNNNSGIQPVQDDTALGGSEAQFRALIEHFDFNRDGELDPQERNEAREVLAREYLTRGLWPAAPRKQNSGTKAASERSAPNDTTENPNAGTRSTPDPAPAPRIHGSTVIPIPATVETPANEMPAD